MDQKWIHFLAILFFYQNFTSGAGEEKHVKEGQRVEINCNPGGGQQLIIWFRILDKSGTEFIASHVNGMVRKSGNEFSSTYSESKLKDNILILKSFKEATDSAAYSCGALVRGNELQFGAVTRLVADKAPEVKPIPTTKQNLCTTPAPCDCSSTKRKGEPGSSLFCTPMILGPLAGGCGLLLLLLIITILYCNKIRTRRCPHHHKRQPRTTAPGKQTPTNRQF